MAQPSPESAGWRRQHVVLFILTFVATTIAGDPGWLVTSEAPTWDTLWSGLSYSVPVMAILFAHEMGHYLQCRRHGVDASAPYFMPGVPVPGLGVLPLIGTLGAFIRMRLTPIESRKLLEIGAWGPLAGYVVAVPVLLVGFYLSEIQPLPDGPVLSFGDSLLLWLGEAIFFDEIPAGHDVFLHPVAMAGWVGCLLTALNLLPVGQLDGGHIAYTIFGRTFNVFAPLTLVVILGLGVFYWIGWFLFALLIATVIGVRHPEITTDERVRGRGRWLGVASLFMFVTTFAPAPIEGASLLEIAAQMELFESLPPWLSLW